jgi:hypothetical protein
MVDAHNHIAKACKIGTIEIVCIVVGGKTWREYDQWVRAMRGVDRRLCICITDNATPIDEWLRSRLDDSRIPPADIEHAIIKRIALSSDANTIASQ